MFPLQLRGITGLQNLHHQLAARAIRLGYNVLTIDGDVFLLQDPYLFFKRPPFSAYHLITQGLRAIGSRLNTHWHESFVYSNSAIIVINVCPLVDYVI